MARTREFNADIALKKATELFWELGYANTSMREMVKHTGVAHAGLYTAFGGKEELFLAALKKYEQRIFSYLFSGLESERASLKDIKKLFSFITGASDDKYFKNGCFIANTALEFSGSSDAIDTILKRTFNRQVKAFEHALRHSLSQGLIKETVDIEETAASLTVLFYGCSSLTRMRAPTDAIERAISSALAAIER